MDEILSVISLKYKAEVSNHFTGTIEYNFEMN